MSRIKPIQVYLDSSDYSVISDPKYTDDVLIKGIYNFLASCIASGFIEIRYSAVHIAEIAHTDYKFKTHSLRRAKLIKELSGLNVLRYPSDLYALDVAALSTLSRIPDFPSYAYDNNGKWFPNIAFKDGDFAAGMRSEFKNSLRERGLPRNTRRLLEKALLQKDGRPNSALLSITQKYQSDDNYIKTLYPLTERFYQENYFGRYITGHLTEAEFRNEIIRGCINPEHFIGWYLDVYDKNKKTIRWLRDFGKEMKELFFETRQSLANAIKSARNLGLDESELYKQAHSFLEEKRSNIRARALHTIIEDNKDLLNSLGVDNDQLQHIISNLSTERLRSFDTFLGLYFEYSKDVLLQTGSPRKLSDSDIPDFVHASYAPYVDVFRADRYSTELLRRLELPSTTLVVNTLAALKDAILSVMEQRGIQYDAR